MEGKLECLFGFHKFTESWKHPVLDSFMKVCVNCRRYIQLSPAVYEIARETPQYLYLHVGFGVYKYRKNENKTLSFAKMVK